MTAAHITLRRVAELEAAGFRVSPAVHHVDGKLWRSWSYDGPGDRITRGAARPVEYESFADAWAAANRDPRAPWTYDDGFSDGAGHGETFADAIRAALAAHPGAGNDATLTRIRAALADYEAAPIPDTAP